jgi:3-methyladenine DNA glycosylase AlkD
MKPSAEATEIVREIRSRLAAIPIVNTPALRNVRREVSRQIKDQTPEVVMQAATLLVNENRCPLRFFAYELLNHHRQTFESLSIKDLLNLGAGIDCWSAVDCFGIILAGPAWLQGGIPDDAIYAWINSGDLWWRRAALVSTVALSRRGLAGDVGRVIEVCARLARDREDMVVKALSWALRELSKKHPEQARRFVAKHRKVLAARIIREVENKLATGLKTPRRKPSAL